MSQKLRTLLTGVQAVFFSFLSFLTYGQATIQTDKLDYKPGDTVIITGGGWEAGEFVSLKLDEIPDLASCEAHKLTAVANANGELYSNQFLIGEGHVGVIFQLTATGQSSGLKATNGFTDAAKTWVGTGSFTPVPGANRDFNNPVNWEPYGVPVSTDDISINLKEGGIITLSADVVIKSLAFNVIASWVNAGLDVINSRLTILNSSAIAITSGNNHLKFGVIDTKGTGVIDFRGDVIISSTSTTYKAELFGTNYSKMIFRGNLTFGYGSGISVNRPGTFEFDGVGEQIITWNNTYGDARFSNLIIGNEHSPTLKMAGTNHVANNMSGNLTLNNASVFDLGLFRCNRASEGGTLTLNGTTTLKLGGTYGGQTGSNFPSNFSTFSFSPASRIEYNAAGQTIYNVPQYANLRLVNGLKSSTGNISVKGLLEIGGDAVLVPGASQVVTGTGKLTGTGTVQVTRTNLTPDFNSQYTIANKDLSQITVEYKGSGAQQISPLNYGSLTITENGTRIVSFPNSGIVAVAGKLSLAATNTSYAVAGSTIDFNGNDQVIPAFNYNNLVLSGIGKKTLQGASTVNGALTVHRDAVLALNSQLLNIYSDWFNEGTVEAGTGVSGVYFKDKTALSGSPVILNNAYVEGALSLFTDLTVTNDFILNTDGNFSPNSSHVHFHGDLHLYGVWNMIGGENTVSFEGSKPQVIHGTGEIAVFYNFEMNNSLGVRLENMSLDINGVLSLDSGVISTGANTLMITSTGSISGGSPASFIDGKLGQVFQTTGARHFPIGKGGEFSLLVFNYTGLDAQSTVVVEQFPAVFPGTPPKGTSLSGSEYWNVSQSGAGSYQYSITLDGPAAMPSGGMVVLRHEAGFTDSYPAGTPNYTVSGLTSLGDFALAEISIVPTSIIAENMSAIYGDMAVDLLATVSPATATGDVEFFIDDNSIGRAALSAGIAKLSFDVTGIPTGNHTIKALYLGDGIFDVSSSDPGSNGELVINALPIEVTAKQQSKVYGNEDPVLTYMITEGRLVGNDQFSGELIRAPGQDEGEYIIRQGTLTLGNNYDLTFVGANLIISPRTIEITVDAKSKIYGADDPALTYSITGGSLAFHDAFMGTLHRIEGEAVGQYEIQQGSLLLNNNYDITFIKASFTIGKRPITVTAIPQQKLYGGNDPDLKYEVSGNCLVANDAFRGVLSRSVGEDVGIYPIRQGTFTAGDNYELTFIESNLTITPAPVSINLTDLIRIYNGKAQGVTVKTTPIGVAVAVTYNGGVAIPVDAGSYAVEAVLANNNYKLVDDLGADLLKQAGVLVISPRTLTIIVNNRSKVYGAENPVLDGTESGLVSSDGIFVSYGTSAQTASDVGEYEIIATISDPNSKLGNYSVTNTAAKLTITPAPAIITLTNLNLTYDGTPKFATAIADPVAAGTNVKYFQGGNEVAVPIAAGSYAIEVVLINKNYAAEPVSSTLMINKAPTRTMVSVISTIYDGKPNGGTASVTGDGGLNQTLAVSYTGTTKAGAPYKGNEAPTEAGDYAAVASYAESDNYLGSFDSQLFSITQALGIITVTDLEKVYNGTAQRPTVITTPADLSVSVTYNGSSSVPIHAGFYAVEAVLNNSNYKAAIGAGTLTIAKKPLTVTAADKIKVYGGPMPVLSGTLSGNVAGDEITVSYSTTAIQNSDVVPGGYPITATLFDPNKRLANYSVTNTPGVLIITPAPATISVTGLSKTYNGQPQAAMVTSLPEGLTVNVTYEGSVTVPTDAGSYAVVAALNSANYSATNGTGTLVIDKADQEIVWETPDPITYGAALGSIQMNARVIGIEGGSPPGALSYTPDAGMILNAGSYVLNVAAAATDNYKAATKTVTLVVNKANQAIDFSPLDDKTYGDPSFNVSAVTSSGRAVSFSIVSGPATINGNTIAITGAGDVVVRASQTGDGNYNPAADVDRTFTVQKATATVTLGSLTQTYDGSVKEVVFTLYPSGLSGVKIIYQQEGVPVTAPISAGTYQVTATLDHINYLATPATSTLEIYKAATVTTITVSDEVYTGNPHGGTAAVIGAADLNQTLSISYTGTTMAGVLYSSNEPPTEAGEYIASASYAESNNYLGSSSSKAFVINKAVSTVSVKYESALFNGSPHSATAIVRGVDDVISDAVVTYVYVGTPNGAPEYSYNSTDAPTLAGSYTVNARFEGNYNYNGDDATATIRIYAIPTVSLSSPSPVAINNISSIKATLGDDVHNVKWFFTSDPSITTGNTQNSQELNIKSSAPNVYSVYVTFEDGLGKSGYVSANVYAVFFDPAAGFVTGGGWISSPEGAYTPNTTLEGKANFGFVSKFEKGKTIPTGNTEFQFQAGGMNFKSNEYEYLVVAGARAQFKGKGTINGIGNFGFMLSAVDENLLGSVSPDKFRIKIWDNNDGGKVVYDNQIGATEDVLPTTVIGGGSIVIHTPGGGSKKANAIAADAYEHELTGPAKFILKAFPNPSVSKFSLRLESDHAEDKIILRIVDLNGRTIEVINNASPGQTYSIGASYRPGVYLVEMIQGSRRSQAMLLKVAD